MTQHDAGLGEKKSIAIACASGSFKCAFVHGVLSAFEELGVRADAYAATSASVLPAAAAVVGMARELGVEYWLRGIEIAAVPGNGMSEVILYGIETLSPRFCPALFAPGAPRFLVPTSEVISNEAADMTQGERASRLGRQLLLDMARGNREWTNAHLIPALFDTASTESSRRLTAENFGAVAYASTRMLHAWKIPAWIDDAPHIDGSYTCSCAAIELAEFGYDEVIAIGTEPGEVYRDLFNDCAIPTSHGPARIRRITPDVDLREMGVDFTKASEEGLAEVYRHGVEKGRITGVGICNGLIAGG